MKKTGESQLNQSSRVGLAGVPLIDGKCAAGEQQAVG